MNRIEEKFNQLKKEKRKGLIGYFTAGFPDFETSIKVILRGVKAGIDIVEIGIPFSDPIADGPVIQYTSNVALEKGMNLERVFSLCRILKKSISVPYLLMTYYNPVYKYGLEKFTQKAEEVGISGLIVPDLPFEESYHLRKFLMKKGIFLINFLTPFTPFERGKKIVKSSEGFIYFITIAGVTGTKRKFDYQAFKIIEKYKKIKDIPFAAGFGISSSSQIRKIKSYVDGIIVGSYLLKKLIYGKIEDVEKSIKDFKKVL